MMTRCTWIRLVAAAVVALAVFGGCSSSDDVASPSPSERDVATTGASAPGDTDDRSPSTVPSADASASSTSTTIGAVTDTGVPGIDSDDAFCRAWSEFAGSFQALAYASGSAADQSTARRAELAAAPAILAAAAALDAHLPGELQASRDVFLDGLLGPFTRRAERASAALADAGLTEAQIEQLGTAWIAQLTESGLRDPNIDPVVPAQYSAAFDDAVAAFGADVPGIVMDPSLATNADASRALDYLSANCADRGILAGIDIVG